MFEFNFSHIHLIQFNPGDYICQTFPILADFSNKFLMNFLPQSLPELQGVPPLPPPSMRWKTKNEWMRGCIQCIRRHANNPPPVTRPVFQNIQMFSFMKHSINSPPAPSSWVHPTPLNPSPSQDQITLPSLQFSILGIESTTWHPPPSSLSSNYFLSRFMIDPLHPLLRPYREASPTPTGSDRPSPPRDLSNCGSSSWSFSRIRRVNISSPGPETDGSLKWQILMR